MRLSKVLAVLGTSACCAAAVAPAHAQFMGIFNGVMNVATQATSKAGGKLLGTDKPVDLEQERAKFMASMEAQTAGMDEAAKARVMSAWGMAEQSFLMSNAQAYRQAKGPLIDWSEAAKHAAGGVMLDRGIGSVFTSAGGLDTVLTGATMDGILVGATGQASGRSGAGARADAARMTGGLVGGAGSIAEAGKAGVAQGIAGSVSGAVSGVTSGAMRWFGGGSRSSAYAISESNHPEQFFGKHPRELSKRDLYRENGNIGWKRVEATATAEAYAPVAGDAAATVAVFNFDPKTQGVIAAFRVLSAAPGDFSRIVESLAQTLGSAPRYASKGDVLRAVFEGGAFVTADATKVTMGWSRVVTETYAAAAPAAPAQNI